MDRAEVARLIEQESNARTRIVVALLAFIGVTAAGLIGMLAFRLLSELFRVIEPAMVGAQVAAVVVMIHARAQRDRVWEELLRVDPQRFTLDDPVGQALRRVVDAILPERDDPSPPGRAR